MADDSFPDLSGEFKPIDEPDGQMNPATEDLPDGIVEQNTLGNHWRISFQRVQYGTYGGQPACLLVIDGRFQPRDRRRHRFKWARIDVRFSGSETQPNEVIRIVPEQAHGVTIKENHSSNWSIRSKGTIGVPGAFATIDIYDMHFGFHRSYPVSRTAYMHGEREGIPVATAAHWIIEEANLEGIPGRIPVLVFLVRYTPGEPFRASFRVEAKIGFSVNPRRFSGEPARTIEFDGRQERVPFGEELPSDFDNLQLAELTRLNLTEEQTE